MGINTEAVPFDCWEGGSGPYYSRGAQVRARRLTYTRQGCCSVGSSSLSIIVIIIILFLIKSRYLIFTITCIFSAVFIYRSSRTIEILALKTRRLKGEIDARCLRHLTVPLAWAESVPSVFLFSFFSLPGTVSSLLHASTRSQKHSLSANLSYFCRF